MSNFGDQPEDHAKRFKKKILINSLLILITDLFVIFLPYEAFLRDVVLHLPRQLTRCVPHVPSLPLLILTELLLE
jgi:hypothetical protein